MKKIFALILAVVTVFALSVPAFAVESNHDSRTDPVTFPGSDNIDIEGTYYKPGDNVVNCYYVTVAWTVTNSLKYTSKQDVYTWDPVNATYVHSVNDATEGAGWTGSARVDITVTNRSVGAVNATCSKPTGVNGVTVKDTVTNFYGDSATKVLSLASAAPLGEGAYKTEDGSGATGAPKSANATCTINGSDLEGTISANGNIAKITVSLAAA